MVIDRVKEKATITGKNAIAKVIQIDNGLNSLTGQFTFMKLSVSAMMLVIAELPNGKDGVENGVEMTENGWRRVARRYTRNSDELIVKAVPVNRAESFEKIGPTQIRLALTQYLVTMGEETEGKWPRFENRENAFKKDVGQDRIRLRRG